MSYKSRLFAILLVSIAISRAADTQLPPPNIDDNNPRLPGKFIWADLVTDGRCEGTPGRASNVTPRDRPVNQLAGRHRPPPPVCRIAAGAADGDVKTLVSRVRTLLPIYTGFGFMARVLPRDNLYETGLA